MNSLCTICDAVLPRAGVARCPECGARGEYLMPTLEPPRHARSLGIHTNQAWDFDPDGPIIRRL